MKLRISGRRLNGRPLNWRRWGAIGVLGAVMLVALDLLLPPPLEKAAIVSPLALDHQGRWLHGFTTDEGRWRFSAGVNEIDPVFIDRLIAIEDKRFYRHPGVDIAALARAGFDAARAGHIRSGASTISMQTARLLEPRPRTIPSKLMEIIRALQIERRLSKREILETYLTLAPYGGNLEGVRAASLAYFGKEPRYLTDAEQALLIALPQAPEARRPDRRNKAAKRARAEILKKLAAAGKISSGRADEAAASVMVSARTPFPGAAYHAARSLVRQEASGAVHTSLDVFVQRDAERLVKAHADEKNGATAALLVIDHETMSVRASVGSSGFEAPGGWIDLTRAVRSPGSALKPFIYALAFEDGLAGPDTIIDDMPRAFGGYRPENFDRTFRGEVRIRQALQHSLNLPAVAALDRFGAPRFAALLKAAGVDLKTGARAAARREGLALALGGAGVTARDIGALYAGLANGGVVRPLVWRANALQGDAPQAEAKPYQLFSRRNAARVNAILKEAPSLAGRAPAALSSSAPRIAFKTGTSYGYRDAWAAGHAGRYTIVAWVGRADGAPRPGITGRKAAAPLLFDMFDALARFNENDGGQPAEELEKEPAPLALAHFSPGAERAPVIVFPRNGVELFTNSKSDDGREVRGFSLAARDGAGQYRWYVSGVPVAIEPTSGRALWKPLRNGFYDVVVVDAQGREARSKVRVHVSG